MKIKLPRPFVYYWNGAWYVECSSWPDSPVSGYEVYGPIPDLETAINVAIERVMFVQVVFKKMLVEIESKLA
jgi:hypothetical protein